MKTRNHDRAPGQTAISFSCSIEMKHQLNSLAQKDKRTLSNYLQVICAEHLTRARSSVVRAENS